MFATALPQTFDCGLPLGGIFHQHSGWDQFCFPERRLFCWGIGAPHHWIQVRVPRLRLLPWCKYYRSLFVSFDFPAGAYPCLFPDLCSFILQSPGGNWRGARMAGWHRCKSRILWRWGFWWQWWRAAASFSVCPFHLLSVLVVLPLYGFTPIDCCLIVWSN